MENLPNYISPIFIVTVLITVILFYKATQNSKLVLAVLFTWLLLQTFIALSGFYTINDSMPPRLTLLLFPPFITIILLLITKKGKAFLNSLNVKTLTLLHVLRIPVEVVLFWLAENKVIPELMTFDGRNFDIVSGITAPFIFYYGYVKNKLPSSVLLIWNFVCLALLLNIIINGILSVPTPFQQFAFDQPNIALMYFPFVFLPGLIVPVILFTHIVQIRQLFIKTSKALSMAL